VTAMGSYKYIVTPHLEAPIEENPGLVAADIKSHLEQHYQSRFVRLISVCVTEVPEDG